jgi:hypothetical protein
MPRTLKILLLLALPMLAACAVTPTGPSVTVLPGRGVSFDQFRLDDSVCRQFAFEQIGGTTADRAAEDAGVRSAVVGTAIGAAAGAVIGGSRGAAVGAGTGLVVGSAGGTAAADRSSYEAQRRYDTSYIQCMYSKGHQVPVSGGYSRPPQPAPYYPPPPPGSAPPPRN